MDKIDYSNTLIYKIYCNDSTISDLYVGHTVNFVQRKLAHKYYCNNDKINNKLYNTIRQNGGWDNWKMDIVGFYNCANLHEAKIKEQEFFISLHATLNSIEPISSKPVKTHVVTVAAAATVEAGAETMVADAISKKFSCKTCEFNTTNKKDWKRHIKTQKHKTNESPTTTIIPHLKCNCGKIYKHSSSLSLHKKSCTFIPNELPNNDLSNRELLIMLLNDNKEFKNIIMEQNNTIMALIENLQQIN